jgi:hypothetical protein
MIGMDAMTRKTDSETGSQKYSSRPYSIGKRIVLALLYAISIAIPTAMVIRLLQLYGLSDFNVYLIVFAIVMVLLVVGVEYLLVGTVVWRFVSPKVEIFENGISRFVIPVFTNRKGDFVPFSDMASFSVSDDGRMCYVWIEGSERPLVWMSYDSRQVRRVVETLRDRNLSER